MRYVIGVDVGTGSARAGVFDQTGTLYGTASHAIPMHHPQSDWAEQSSDLIWEAICRSVRESLSVSGIAADLVSGISYSATCSLVLLDRADKPLSLSEADGEAWNILVWMDHRATAEAEEATASQSVVLRNVGGTMSPEMEVPKLMWLKRHRPDLWSELGFAGDLADYLTYRSSGSTARSVCTLGCKWTFDPDQNAWNREFLTDMGIEDMLARGQLPDHAVPIGSPLGPLAPQAARDLGLTESCQVATGLIDAHAGALGTIGLFADDRIEERMALIAGTSNCHIALAPERIEVPGVWGPYGGAVVGGMWCNEGGQSVTGALLDHVVALLAQNRLGDNPHAELANSVKTRADALPDFAGEIEVFPDFLGNRAPFADPDMRGAITGLTIEDPWETFEKVYWATAASIAYGTRMIIDQMNASGYRINTIHLSGGHKKSPLFIDLYADATDCQVVLSDAPEPVLLGAAIAALQQFAPNEPLSAVTDAMTFGIELRKPRASHAQVHSLRYQNFLRHYQIQGLSLQGASAQ